MKDQTPRNAKGKPHGLWEDYFPSGQLSYKGHYINGERHGYWEVYYSNGQLYYKGHYVNNKCHGYWERYHDNGSLDYKGYYDNGKRVSHNPDEPKVVELTLEEIARLANVPVTQLRIKE